MGRFGGPGVQTRKTEWKGGCKRSKGRRQREGEDLRAELGAICATTARNEDCRGGGTDFGPERGLAYKKKERRGGPKTRSVVQCH